MAATPRYYPAEDAPKGKAKAAIKHNVSVLSFSLRWLRAAGSSLW